MSASVTTDESGGGGIYNKFTKDKTVVGPSLGLGLTWPTDWGKGVFRYTANWMPSVTVSGTSAINNFDYTGKVKGGRQDIFQLGFMVPFF